MTLKTIISDSANYANEISKIKNISDGFDSNSINTADFTGFKTILQDVPDLQTKVRLLSKAGLDANQIYAVLRNTMEDTAGTTISLAMANEGLTIEMSELNAQEVISNTLNKMSNKEDKEKLINILKQVGAYEGLENAKYGDVQATLAQAVAENKLSAEQISFLTNLGILQRTTTKTTKSFGTIINVIKGLVTALTQASLATKLFVGGMIAFAAFKIGKGIFEFFHTSTEELKESATESASALDETTQELENYQTELETTKNRIEELEGLESLTIIEQQELSKLKDTESYLEKMIKLQEKLAEEKTKIAFDDAMELISTKTTGDLTWSNLISGKINLTDKKTPLEQAESLLTRIENDQKLRDETEEKLLSLDPNKASTKEIESLKRQIKMYEDSVKDKSAELTETLSQLSDSMIILEQNKYDENGRVNEEVQKILDQYYSIPNRLDIITGDVSESIQNMISELAGSETDSKVKSAADFLVNLSSEDINNTTLIDDINSAVLEVQNELVGKGYEISVDDIKVAYNISDIDSIKKQIEKNLEESGLLELPGMEQENVIEFANEVPAFGVGSVSVAPTITSGEYLKHIISELINNSEDLNSLYNADWSNERLKKLVENFNQIRSLYEEAEVDDKNLSMKEFKKKWEPKSNEYDFNFLSSSTLGFEDEVYNFIYDLFQKTSTTLSETMNVTSDQSKELAKDFSDMWADEDWQESNSDLISLAKSAKVTASDIEDLANSDSRLGMILEQQGMSAQFAASCLNQIGTGGSIFEFLTSDVLNLNAVLNETSEAFEKVDSAISKYETITGAEDYNTDFQSFATAYDDIMTDFENGNYGKHFWARAELLLGADAFEMSVDQVYKAVARLDSVFDDENDNGLAMLTRLSKTDLSKYGIKDSYVKKNKNGSYDWNIEIDELKQLAKAAGMSEEALTSCLKALGMFEGTRLYDVDKLEEALLGMDIALDGIEGKTTISKQALETMLSNLGYTGKEAYQIISDIMKMDTVKVIDFELNSQNAEEVMADLQELDIFKGFELDKDLDSETFTALIEGLNEEMGMSADQVVDFIEKLKGAGYIFRDLNGEAMTLEETTTAALNVADAELYTSTVEEAKTSLNEFKEAVDEVTDEDKKVQLEADISTYEEQIRKAEESGLGVPEEIITKLSFEVDKVDLQKEIESAQTELKYSVNDEQKENAAQKILTSGSQYIDKSREQIGMSQEQFDSSNLGEYLTKAYKQFDTDDDYENLISAVEFARNTFDEFIDKNPEINFTTNTEEAQKELNSFFQESENLQILVKLNNKELETQYNNFIDGCNALGIIIDLKNVEESKQQLQSVETIYDTIAQHMQDNGINIDVATEEGRAQITALLESLPEDLKTEITTNPDGLYTILDEILVYDGETLTFNTEADIDEAKKSIKKIQKTISETSTMPVEANTTPGLKSVNSLVKTIESKNPKIPIAASTSSAKNTVDSFIKQIGGKTAYVTIKAKTYGFSNPLTTALNGLKVNGTAHVEGTAHASGRWGVPKTEKGSLVGELGPEIFVNPNTGTFTTVGDNGPEFVDIPKNTIIFNHKQTESLLKNGYALGRGKVVNGSAHVEGTAHASSTSTKKTTYKNISSSASKTSSSNSNSNNSNSSSSSTADEVSNALTEAFDKFFDWIEVRVEHFENKISYYEAKMANYTSYTNQNSMVDQQITNLKKLIETDQKGISKYLSQANTALATGKKSLTSAQKKQVDNAVATLKAGGSINISSYAEEVRTVIEEYQEWYNKSIELSTALEENKARLEELAAVKLENIDTYYQNRVNYYSSKSDERQSLIDYIQSKNSYSLATSSYGNSSDYDTIYKAYQSIISNNNNQAKMLIEEYSKLSAQLNSEVKKGNIKKYSSTYYEWVATLDSLSSELSDVNSQTQEYYKTLYSLPLEKATQATEELGNALSLLESKTELAVVGSNAYNKVLQSSGNNSFNTTGYNYELANKLLDQQVENLKQQNSKYQSALNSITKTLNSTTKGNTQYYAALAAQKDALAEAQQSQIEYAETMQNVAKEAFDNIISEFDSLCSKLASDISLLNSKLEYLQNFDGSYSNQKDLLQSSYIKNEEQVNKQYEAIQKAQAEYNKRKSNMTDEDRIAAQTEINSMWEDYYSLLSESKNILQQIFEINNAISFDDHIAELEKSTEELENIKSLITLESLDSEGNLTSAGAANVAIISEAISNAQEQIGLYQTKMKALNDAYEKGILNTEEYEEALEECRDAIFDNASSIQSYKQELIDLYKDQMSKELDTLNEIITKRKEALQSMQDYYDYADSIKTQNKDIESLQAQIQALEGVDDATTKSQVAQLKAQLQEAQEALDDSIDNHRLDVLNEGYDSLSEDAQTTYDEIVKSLEDSSVKQEEIVNSMLNTIKQNYKDAYAEISDIIDEFNLKVGASTQVNIDVIKNGTSSATVNSSNNNNNSLINQNTIDKVVFKEVVEEFLNSLDKTSRTKEQINNPNYTSPLYAYVANKYGKHLSHSDMLYLGGLLGVSGLPTNPNGLAGINNSSKDAILKALKVAGFSKGGIIEDSFTPINSIFDVIKTNGDNSLVVGARAGESILTEKFTAMLPNLLQNIELFNGTFDAIKNMDFTMASASSQQPIQIHFDSLINIQGNVDKDVMKELEKYSDKLYEQFTRKLRKELQKMQ